MKKPADLRARLVALMPELARDADRLAMWIEKGRVRSRLGAHGFAWEYELTVLLKEFAGDPAVPFFVTTEWLRDAQPDVIAPGGQNGFAFEVDILDDRTFDVQMVLKLEECVSATPQPGGAWVLEPIVPASPVEDDERPFGAGARLTSIWVDGVRVAPPA